MADDFDRGRKLGKYEILARVSVGGMAELFLAFLPGPGGFKKFVALKQILPDVRSDPEFVKMFLDEARISAQLSHPNIGQVFDLGRDEESGELYLAMEFIAGQNLGAVMRAVQRAQQPIPVPAACRIARDVCLGLHAAHTFVDPAGRKQSIIHRDVAPKNIMVTYDGFVKVIDFGIAKAKGRLVRTVTGQVRGTLSYMSPEQVQEKPLDGRSDLFAVGTILHELLTGNRLFTGEGAGLQILQKQVPSPRLVRDDVPEELAAVVHKSLQKEPRERFESGRLFARAIELACPQVADEEDLAAFMAALFGPQLAHSRALFDAAQADAAPEELSGLVKRLAAPGLSAAGLGPVRDTMVSSSNLSPNVVGDEPRPATSGTGHAREGGTRALSVVAGVLMAGVLLAAGVAWFLSRGLPEEPHAVPELQPRAKPDGPLVPGTGQAPTLFGPELTAVISAGQNDLAEGRAADALEKFERALAASPKHKVALPGAVMAALGAGQLEVAKRHVQELLDAAVTPQELAQAEVKRARVLVAMNEPAEARKALAHAVDLVGEGVTKELDDPALAAVWGKKSALAPVAKSTKPPVGKGKGGASNLSPEVAQLVAEATEDRKAKNHEAALGKLTRCIKQQPDACICYRLMGASYAALSAKSESNALFARKAYEKFLACAPPTDEYVPKVRQLLAQ